MIIHAGMRTDIPAFFSDWFLNRIQDGFVLTRNPYYPEQVTRYQLTPELVDCLCFCTKNPAPMISRLEELRSFRQFWSVTITPYGNEIEPFVPEKKVVMHSLKELSKQVGIHSVSWRYDPIFISETYSLDFHIKTFEKMARELHGYVNHCVISFIDLYEKTKRNFPGVKEVTKEERIAIGKEFTRIGNAYGIQIRSCCEGTELEEYGVDASGCLTQEVMEQALGYSLRVPKSKKPSREGCNCLLGNDIGMYNTCSHGCIYCYANYDTQTVKQNCKLHDPTSPFLIGGSRAGDQIKDAKQISYYDGQMKLEF